MSLTGPSSFEVLEETEGGVLDETEVVSSSSPFIPSSDVISDVISSASVCTILF